MRFTESRWEAEAGALLEDLKGLAQPLAVRHEFVGCRGVEFEHIVVTRDDEAGVDVAGELRRFAAPKIAGDAALGGSTIDRQERDIHRLRTEPFGHALVTDGVAAVINTEGAEFDDKSKMNQQSLRVAVEVLVGGWNGGY